MINRLRKPGKDEYVYSACQLDLASVSSLLGRHEYIVSFNLNEVATGFTVQVQKLVQATSETEFQHHRNC